MAPLVLAVSRSLAAGTDVTDLKRELQVVADPVARSPFSGSSLDPLPIRVAFLDFGANGPIQRQRWRLREHIPTAVWFFAPGSNKKSVE